jgi:hypothetical protein
MADITRACMTPFWAHKRPPLLASLLLWGECGWCGQWEERTDDEVKGRMCESSPRLPQWARRWGCPGGASVGLCSWGRDPRPTHDENECEREILLFRKAMGLGLALLPWYSLPHPDWYGTLGGLYRNPFSRHTGHENSLGGSSKIHHLQATKAKTASSSLSPELYLEFALLFSCFLDNLTTHTAAIFWKKPRS